MTRHRRMERRREAKKERLRKMAVRTIKALIAIAIICAVCWLHANPPTEELMADAAFSSGRHQYEPLWEFPLP